MRASSEAAAFTEEEMQILGEINQAMTPLRRNKRVAAKYMLSLPAERRELMMRWILSQLHQ